MGGCFVSVCLDCRGTTGRRKTWCVVLFIENMKFKQNERKLKHIVHIQVFVRFEELTPNSNTITLSPDSCKI